jgi:uncharacterized delta-60 repeat protein
MKKAFSLFFILISYLVYSQNNADIDLSFIQNNWQRPGTNNTSINSIAIQSDNKILIGGYFTTFNGSSQNSLIRLNADGSKDTSFNIGSGTTGNVSVRAIAIQTDGKILVGGDFFTFNGSNLQPYLIRLNSNGTRDTSFSFSAGWEYQLSVNTIKILSTNKILIGGNKLAAVTGVSSGFIYRLNTTGSIDTTFNTGLGFDKVVNTIAIESSGTILIGGSFTKYNNIDKKYIVRLNNNGSINNSLAIPNPSFNDSAGIFSILVQPDNKILLGGYFTVFNNNTQNRLIRISGGGLKDTSFNIGSGFNGPLAALAIQSDGKILVGGSFDTFNGSIQNKLVRLNTNGSKDTSFNILSGFDSFGVTELVFQNDGKLLVGGPFGSYKGQTINNRLIRLNGTSNLSNYEFNNEKTLLYPNPAIDKFTIDFGDELLSNYTIKINNMLGQEVYSNVINEPQFEVSKTWQGEGMYFIKIYNENKNLIGTKKIILQ